MLSGYSLVLYLLPTIFCMVPSVYWRILMLFIGGFLRTVFLFLNYSTKLPARRILLLILLVSIELIYAFLVYRIFFLNDSLGYGFAEGFSAVFGTTPTNTQVAADAPDITSATTHTLATTSHLRRF